MTENKEVLTEESIINIGKKQLNMMKSQPLPPLVDLSLSRMYFHSFWDAILRFTLLTIHIVWIITVFFYGIGFGQAITDSLQISVIVIQQSVLRVITMLITISFTAMILIMILPLFLVKTIRGVGYVCIFYLIYGTFFNLFLIGIGVYADIISNSPYRITALTFACLTIIAWWVTLSFWFISAARRKKAVTKSIIKTYQLNFK